MAEKETHVLDNRQYSEWKHDHETMQQIRRLRDEQPGALLQLAIGMMYRAIEQGQEFDKEGDGYVLKKWSSILVRIAYS